MGISWDEEPTRCSGVSENGVCTIILPVMAIFEMGTWWQSIGFWFWVLYFQTNTCFLIFHSSRGRTSRSNHCQSTVRLMVRNLPQFLRITRLVTDYDSTPMYTPNLKTSRFLLPEKGAELTILTLACNHHMLRTKSRCHALVEAPSQNQRFKASPVTSAVLTMWISGHFWWGW